LRRLCRLRRILLFGSGNCCDAPVRELGAELHKIKLIESPNNSCEIYGADLEEVATRKSAAGSGFSWGKESKIGSVGAGSPGYLANCADW
jgi:hypothetical protein